MNLSDHDRELLGRMSNEWMTQHQLKTSRQTMNKLVKAGLVKRQIMINSAKYVPDQKVVYRLC